MNRLQRTPTHFRRLAELAIGIVLLFVLCHGVWAQTDTEKYFDAAKEFIRNKDWEKLSSHLNKGPEGAYSDIRYACLWALNSYAHLEISHGDTWAKVCMARMKGEAAEKETIDKVGKTLEAGRLSALSILESYLLVEKSVSRIGVSRKQTSNKEFPKMELPSDIIVVDVFTNPIGRSVPPYTEYKVRGGGPIPGGVPKGGGASSTGGGGSFGGGRGR